MTSDMICCCGDVVHGRWAHPNSQVCGNSWQGNSGSWREHIHHRQAPAKHQRGEHREQPTGTSRDALHSSRHTSILKRSAHVRGDALPEDNCRQTLCKTLGGRRCVDRHQSGHRNSRVSWNKWRDHHTRPRWISRPLQEILRCRSVLFYDVLCFCSPKLIKKGPESQGGITNSASRTPRTQPMPSPTYEPPLPPYLCTFFKKNSAANRQFRIWMIQKSKTTEFKILHHALELFSTGFLVRSWFFCIQFFPCSKVSGVEVWTKSILDRFIGDQTHVSTSWHAKISLALDRKFFVQTSTSTP